MKAKDILFQLVRMEDSLHEFSYEELTAEEATNLKNNFDNFKKNLEEKLFQPNGVVSSTTDEESYENFEVTQPAKSDAFDTNMLVARVSHEIRTPLNGIIGFTDLLKEDNELNNSQLERVNAIQKASYSLMEIINELLEYSKLSAGLATFESVDFNFRTTIGDVTYLCTTLISNKAVDLSIEIAADIPQMLIGDPSKLTQVLLNVLGNATKFIEKGSIDLKIEIQKQEKGNLFLNFIIADTGIGISEENLKHIFDSFKQAESDTYSMYGGSGLGLSIVKQIIEKSGGHIGVISTLGTGTTFSFSMPFQIGDSNSPILKRKLSDADLHEARKQQVKGMRILVFEDNSMNQKLIDERLKSWGCTTFITQNAEYGLHVLANHTIDLVLMDLQMPIMNGFEITKLIRDAEEQQINSVSIIALSADFSVLDKRKCELNGINDFILKPFSPEDLLEQLTNAKTNQKPMQIPRNPPINLQETTNERAVSLTGLFDDCMGQIDLLHELTVLFEQNAAKFITSVGLHLAHQDFDKIGFEAHKMKSGLAMVKAYGLLDITNQIQACTYDKDIQGLHDLYNCFNDEYPKVAAAIEKALNELRK